MLAAGGVLLAAALFLDWYGVEGSGAERSAWQVYTVLDVLLAVVAAMAIGAAIMAAAHNTPAASLALASLTAPVAFVAAVIVLVRTLSPPGLDAFGLVVATGEPGDTTLLAAHWLGLAAVSLVTVAAFASMRDERFPRGARIEVPVETIPPPEGGKA
jgi:drug/metabolite transporter (DMT)-like permease